MSQRRRPSLDWYLLESSTDSCGILTASPPTVLLLCLRKQQLLTACHLHMTDYAYQCMSHIHQATVLAICIIAQSSTLFLALCNQYPSMHCIYHDCNWTCYALIILLRHSCTHGTAGKPYLPPALHAVFCALPPFCFAEDRLLPKIGQINV